MNGDLTLLFQYEAIVGLLWCSSIYEYWSGNFFGTNTHGAIAAPEQFISDFGALLPMAPDGRTVLWSIR